MGSKLQVTIQSCQWPAVFVFNTMEGNRKIRECITVRLSIASISHMCAHTHTEDQNVVFTVRTGQDT